MRVACQQLAPAIAAFDANRVSSVDSIRAAVGDGAELVILPELVTSGYVFASREEAASTAITVSHPVFAEWAAEVSRVRGGRGLVIGGFCELGDGGNLYNSAAVVSGEGVLAVYRKTHLWDREKLFFKPGSDPAPVVCTRVGRIGVAICYDLEFPELTRGLALRGAELIAVPTNWPRVPCPQGEHPPEVIIAMAAARSNRVFIACCDRAGVERGQSWTEGTSIVDVDGWVVARAEAGTAMADVDLVRARDKRLTDLADALGDRRPELYGDVVQAREHLDVDGRPAAIVRTDAS
jgi:predicted amidohydrolase